MTIPDSSGLSPADLLAAVRAEQQQRPEPGTRVTWAEDPDDDRVWRGTVREPTADELDYVTTWPADEQEANLRRVLVAWDGDEPWEGAWHDPCELRRLTPEEAISAGYRGNRPCPPACPCWTPGPVCEEWMGLDQDEGNDDHEFCPRCGWAKHLHPDTEETR